MAIRLTPSGPQSYDSSKPQPVKLGSVVLPPPTPPKSSGGHGSLPQSSPTNITPPAAANQTMESVAAQSYQPSPIQQAQQAQQKQQQQAQKASAAFQSKVAENINLQENLVNQARVQAMKEEGRNIPIQEFNQRPEVKIYRRDLERDPYFSDKAVFERIKQSQNVGEKVIYDKNGKAVGVQSAFLGKSMPIEKYELEIKRIQDIAPLEKYFNPRTGQITDTPQGTQVGNYFASSAPKVYIDPKTNRPITDINEYIIKNRIPTASLGKFDIGSLNSIPTVDFSRIPRRYFDRSLQQGEVMAVTPEDVFTLSTLPISLSKMPLLKAAKFIGSGLITGPANKAYESVYNPKTRPGRIIKASIGGYLVSRNPTLGEAYLADLTKGIVTNPKGVADTLVTNWPETLGFGLGAGFVEKGLNRAELKLRGVKTETVNLPDYGDVVVQRIPKYKDIVWVKGNFAQSEKVDIIEQINRLRGNKERVFVQVSPKGVPLKVFSKTKNLGFEVSQVSNPMRGLYEAPPFKFLEKYKDIINTNYGATSFYASGARRESALIPNVLDLLRAKVSDKFSNQRPFQYIERTFKPINTPKWVEEVAQAMKEGKEIPRGYVDKVNSLYKSFLNKPVEFNGKIYKGLEKEKLLNDINLRSRGSGTKLKVYSALLEYQTSNKVTLVGGAELLSGIQPFGPEAQIVRGIGSRFFAKSLKDLRKGIKPSISSKVVELLTGTKRGQKVALVEGMMVEIQPVRSFTKKISEKGKSARYKPEEITGKMIDKLISRREEPTIRRVPRPISVRTYNLLPERKIVIARREVRVNRINRLLISPRPTRTVSRRSEPRSRREEQRSRERPRSINRETREPRRIERDREREVTRRIISRLEPPRRREERRPTRRSPPNNPIIRNLLSTQKGLKKRIVVPVSRKTKSQTLPTVYEELLMGSPKGKRAKLRITGFEALRFR